MTRLYLHIGQPKTATTSLQLFLLTNTANLRREGWLYPRAMLQSTAHHALGNFFIDAPQHWIHSVDPAASLAELKAEIYSTGATNVILSTESLFFIPKPALAADYFRDFDTRIVITLRRQDSWMESAYRDMVKTGDFVGRPAAFLDAYAYALDYENFVRRWADAFGADRILIDTFEKTPGGRPVEDRFIDRIGADLKGPFERVPPQNDTLSRDTLAFYSEFAERPRSGYRNGVFQEVLMAYSAQHPDAADARAFFPPADRARMVAARDAANGRIARAYLGRDNLFEAPPPDPDEPWVPYHGLSMKRAVSIAEFMANRLFEQSPYHAERAAASSWEGGGP